MNCGYRWKWEVIIAVNFPIYAIMQFMQFMQLCNFFQASNFQLHKLENSLRWSLLTFIYIRSSYMNYFIYFTSSWSWLLFLRCLLFIHQQNSCFDVWQSLISVSVLLHNPSTPFTCWRLLKDKCKYCQARWIGRESIMFCFVWGIDLNILLHKCGQTPSLEVGTEIQTHCNFVAR